MGILMVTSLSSYAKNMEMALRWQKRQEESDYTPDTEDKDSVDKAFREKLDEFRYPEYDRSSQMEGDIEIKLTAGKELNEEEMLYLKKHDPSTYRMAKVIIRERKAYEKELQACKTKDEVEQLKASRAEAAVNRIRAIKNNSSISAEQKRELFKLEHFKAAALDDAMHEFMDTPHYKALPSEAVSLKDGENGTETGETDLDLVFPKIHPLQPKSTLEEAEETKTPAEKKQETKKSSLPETYSDNDNAGEEGTIMKAILDEEARWAREEEENNSDPQKINRLQEEETPEIFRAGQAKAAYLASQNYTAYAETSKINVRR